MYKQGDKLKLPSWQEYHLTVKGSPSGGQALVNCLQDLVNLPESLINSIACFSGSEELSSNMALLRRHASELSEVLEQPIASNSSFRRVVAFPDSEGKTRLIALGDY